MADPEHLLVYKDTEAFSVIRDIVMNCTRDSIGLPSHLVGTEKLLCVFLKIF